ncbi:hypothetical protein E4U22_002267 [Claviceps purpurea]|nr:hypothetical protein E4U22_002267 [Claviceps purpurea]
MEAPTVFSPWLLIPTILTVLIALNMGFFRKNKLPVEGKTVLLTGASEGMGLAAAKQLSAKGANVVIVSRGIPKLQEALESVKVGRSLANVRLMSESTS